MMRLRCPEASRMAIPRCHTHTQWPSKEEPKRVTTPHNRPLELFGELEHFPAVIDERFTKSGNGHQPQSPRVLLSPSQVRGFGLYINTVMRDQHPWPEFRCT